MESNITDEIQQIEQQYATMPPDNSIKKTEPIYDENYIKIESTTTHNNFNKKIKTIINNSYSKTKIINSDYLVGVIKDITCQGYPELDFYMDCEDNNPATTSHGWIGSSYVDNAKNVMFKLCVVDGIVFHKTNVDYAVLDLGIGGTLGGAVTELVWITNEEGDQYSNGSNSNSSNATNNQFGNCYFRYEVHIHENHQFPTPDCDGYEYFTILRFHYFQKNNLNEINGSSFPNLTTLGGWNYGVFGRFGQHQGYIFSDDEDSNGDNGVTCSNAEYKKNHNSGGVSGIVVNESGNTRFYMSKVTTCGIY